MKNLILAFAILGSINVFSQTKMTKNCYEEYHEAFLTRGTLPVPDGTQKVVYSLRSDTGCYCGEGKVIVKGGNIQPYFWVKKEDGTYEPAKRELHVNMQQGHIISQNQFSIHKAMSQTFMTADNAIVDLFFTDYLKRKVVANAKAPSPNEIEGTPVQLEGKQKEIVQKAYEGLQFANGKSDIKSTSFPHLNLLADMLKENKDYKIQLNGYTDNVGKAESNLKLSQNRARAVKNYLVKQGVEENRIGSAGFGIEKPIGDNATSEGRAKNRRVEFIVEK